MFESSNQFFPTPSNVIVDMVSTLRKNIQVKLDPVLDPSAGKGDILEYLQRSRYARRLYAIELDPELLFILQGKKFKVIGTDFLAYSEQLKFNSILMNPPFNKGVDHVLKAWELLNDGGCLVALVNSETVNNSYSKNRQNLVQLIELYGSCKSLGQCFANAERATNVDVSMIVLNKPKLDLIDQFGNIGLEFDSGFTHEKFNPSALAHSNAIADLVSRYKAAEKVLIERYESQQKLDFYLQGIDSGYGVVSHNIQEGLINEINIDEQILALKARFWGTVIEKSEMHQKVTSKFKEKLIEFTNNYSSLAFTVDNIQSLLMLFVDNFADNMVQCIIDVFDLATRYCHKNIVHYEGWKTNKGHKINKTIIIPYGVSNGHVAYDKYDFFHDLDRIMCYLSGKNMEQIETVWNVLRDTCQDRASGEWQESTFFKVKYYLKETVHIQFKDLKLLDEFNLIAGQNKKWVGGEGY